MCSSSHSVFSVPFRCSSDLLSALSRQRSCAVVAVIHSYAHSCQVIMALIVTVEMHMASWLPATETVAWWNCATHWVGNEGVECWHGRSNFRLLYMQRSHFLLLPCQQHCLMEWAHPALNLFICKFSFVFPMRVLFFDCVYQMWIISRASLCITGEHLRCVSGCSLYDWSFRTSGEPAGWGQRFSWPNIFIYCSS